MTNLESFTMYGTKREILYYKLGQELQTLLMVDWYNSVIELYGETYLNDCFKLWFEYYGVGE